MGFNIVLTGMVLSAVPSGEYDKRITILTKERGKITAFAKGARRSGNQLLAAANPFAFGQFEVYQGKSSYTVVRADIKNYFRELVEDFDMVCYGYYFLEVAEYFTQENNNESEQLKLLYQTLRALESGKFPSRLIRGIYELKTLTIFGEYPNVFECLSCGKKEDLLFFNMDKRGCICRECVKNSRGRAIGPTALYAMQFVIASPVAKLFTFSLSDEVLEEFCSIISDYWKRYVNHTFRSEDFLTL